MPPSFVLLSLNNRRLSLRLLLAIGGCLLAGTLLAIGLQLTVEYRRDLAGLHSRLQFIQDSYVPALAASAYQLDEEQIRLQLRGVLQLQDMVHVLVREQLNKATHDIVEGSVGTGRVVTREYPLVYQALRPVPVGMLVVGASVDGIFARLKQRVLTIALTSALMVVPLAIGILMILQMAVNRHLVRMARYAANLNLDSLDQELQLRRSSPRAGKPDELDQLVHAINEMRLRIQTDMRHRQQVEQELLFRKALFECVLEARIDGLCIVGKDHTCLFANNHFRALWQAPDLCLPGVPVQPTFTCIEKQLMEVDAFRAVRARIEETPDVTLQGEVDLVHGSVYEYYTVPVQNSEGTQYGRLWSFRDISQRKIMEEQLRQARKLETLGSLAGGIAHDFNNLLSPIIGYAELGMNRVDPGEPVFADLGQIIKAASRAADLTRQILAFSRKQMLEVRVIDLNELIREFESMVRRLIGETITVQTILCAEPALIRADKGQLEQVLLNMAINARDAMPEGGTLTIETAPADLDQRYAERHVEVEAGDYVMLSISDTGVGIAEAIRDRIFEPFFTTKERGKGTGLGLATSFGIIKQHRGHIWVYSEPGHGTTFKIYLPRAEEGSLSRPEMEQAESPLTPGGGHVLVVEDDMMVRELVRETLIAYGYRVTEAEHPDRALELAARVEAIDLLLTDVILPKMNGRELHRRLCERIPGLKVVYMSGYTENVIADQGMLYEGVEFIQKPFSVRALVQKIQQVLG